MAIATTRVTRGVRTGYINRNAKEDSFELSLSQLFIGPYEVDLPKTERRSNIATFTYSTYKLIRNAEGKNRPWGTIKVEFIDNLSPSSYFSILFCHIETMEFVPIPAEGTGILLMQIGEAARKEIRKRFNLTKDFITETFQIDLEEAIDAFKYVVLIFKSWSADINHILKIQNNEKCSYQDFNLLAKKLTQWVKMIRDEDYRFAISKKLLELPSNEFTSVISNKAEISRRLRGFHLHPQANHLGDISYRFIRPIKPANKLYIHQNDLIKVIDTDLNDSPTTSRIISQEPNEKSTIHKPHTMSLRNRNDTATKKTVASTNEMPKEPSIKKRKRNNKNNIVLADNETNNIVPPKDEYSDDSSGTELLCYNYGKMNVSLIFRDVERLAPEMLLNDNIIEFFLYYLMKERFTTPELKDNIHIYSTFFFSKLIMDPPRAAFYKSERGKSSRKAWLRKNFQLLKKWTRNVDIFSKKFLVIPVNYEEHWFVIIVMNPGNSILSKNNSKNSPTPENSTMIFVLNSLIMARCRITENSADIIKEYLLLEFEDKKMKAGDSHISEERIKEINVVDIVGQENLSDCGVFLLAYTEMFIMWTPLLTAFKGFVFNFYQYWPFFKNTTMISMRYKILTALKNNVQEKLWQRVINYEVRNNQTKQSSEALLLDELNRRGIRRWQSQADIRAAPISEQMRCRSVDRKYGDEALDIVFDPVLV